MLQVLCICVLVVFANLSGESGLGKSTLIQSLFLTNFFGNKTSSAASGETLSHSLTGVLMNVCCVLQSVFPRQ